MFKKQNVYWLSLLAVLIFSTTVEARGGWVYLGNAHVDGGADHDKIKVDRSEAFRALQLRVEGAAVGFRHVVIHYGNGGQEQIPAEFVVQSGGRSRAIDLPGDRRAIKDVELWYNKGKWANRPTVNLFGMY